ncbi:MAG: hypothetical protein M3O50_17160 [Myxococcota bacterium]|nr:hypothetical protein [Myxococcota bacterium]
MKQKKLPAIGNVGGLALVGLLVPVLATLGACGTSPKPPGGFTGTSSGASFVGGSGAIDDSGVPLGTVPADDGGPTNCLACGDATGSATVPYAVFDGGTATGSFTAPDCPGCTFPPAGAPACPATPAPINVVYPPDTVLLPPNMNVISVQWTPFGAPYTEFEVDFKNANTDVQIVTKCTAQTMDTGTPSMPSGGCELVVPPGAFSSIENANRGGAGVNVTVRGTTDGKCATESKPIQISFAEEDLLGTYYYWKSTVSSNGVGGQIWKKTFGDLATAEANVTQALPSTCNGCHVLSRDGSRMVVYSDDNDSDDEYSDVWGLLLNTGVTPPVILSGSGMRNNGQPPGFSTINPTATLYLTSNGVPTPPTNNFFSYSAVTGAPALPNVTVGVDGQRPTMPDWSPDATSVIYVLPKMTGDTWQSDDDHEFGGSLYSIPYMGNQTWGAPAVFLQSKGENNYYPSYSPDSPSSFVVFDRAALDTQAGPNVDGCIGTEPKRSCRNDSFSNPAARLMLTGATPGKFVIDLEKANGSPAAKPVDLSNSFPKWTPFVQTYHGQKMFWVTFSSTRDYGIRVLNHKTGMYQCYPPDSFEMSTMTQHHGKFAPECQQPQLWMAPITLNEGFNGMTDPSHVAFWIPYQDITTHNHTPQWTHQNVVAPPPKMCIPSGANCLTNPTACCNTPGAPPLYCTGNGKCGQILN